MSGMKSIMTTITMGAVVCIGYGFWAVIAPSEERKREILKNLPEANPVRMEEMRKKNTLIMQMLKEAAETKDNITRGTGPPK